MWRFPFPSSKSKLQAESELSLLLKQGAAVVLLTGRVSSALSSCAANQELWKVSSLFPTEFHSECSLHHLILVSVQLQAWNSLPSWALPAGCTWIYLNHFCHRAWQRSHFVCVSMECWQVVLPISICPMGGVLLPGKSFFQPEETNFDTYLMHRGGIFLFSICISCIFKLY